MDTQHSTIALPHSKHLHWAWHGWLCLHIQVLGTHFLPTHSKLSPGKRQASSVHTGNLVYHGPRENVMEFFESLGFACPERKGIADFLQEVTSRKDQKVHYIFPACCASCVPVWQKLPVSQGISNIEQIVTGGRAMLWVTALLRPASRQHPETSWQSLLVILTSVLKHLPACSLLI